jgi:crotonobetainyl-CoA:carnitine CoA-transferase CaiB-like acyl-CoA transferase
VIAADRDSPLSGALSGLRVIEWGTRAASAYAARLLADLGADVVTVERPDGHPLRRRGPFPNDTPDPERSGAFLALNLNKRGIVLDVDTDTGRQRLRDLLDRADVLIEDVMPSEQVAAGLDHSALCHRNPGLIVASITPFGRTGPRAHHRAADLNVWHAAGSAWTTVARSENPAHTAPLRAAALQAEHMAGAVAAVAILTALYRRAETGCGGHIDLSMQEAVASAERCNISIAQASGGVPPRHRSQGAQSLNCLPCADGYVSFVLNEQHQWERFLALIGAADLLESEIFRDRSQRFAYMDAVVPRALEWTMQRSKQAIFDEGQAGGIPVFPVNDVAEVRGSDQLAARDFFITLDHPAAGPLSYPGTAMRLSATPPTFRRPAPLLGQHTREVVDEWCAAGEFARMAPRPAVSKHPATTSAPAPALAGLRVLDLTWMAAGPYPVMLLAFMGAEVIKVESRQRIDWARRWPPLIDDDGGPNRSPQFAAVNLNKRSCTLNLKQPEAIDLVKRLVAVSDIVAENFGAGTLETLGLDYASLRRINPNVILLSVNPLGRTGPRRNCIAYGASLVHYTGLTSLTGYPGALPAAPGGYWPDWMAGPNALIALLAALRHRRRTGDGQYVEVSMHESVVMTLGEAILDAQMNGRIEGAMGNRDRQMAPHGCYPCRPSPLFGDDGTWVTIAVEDDAQWRSLCRVLGRPDLAADPRLGTAAGRRAAAEELDAVLSTFTCVRDAEEVVERCQAAGIPAARTEHAFSLLADAHLAARGFFPLMQHAEMGALPTAGVPWTMTGATRPDYRPAPLLGEHTAEILHEVLGLSGGEIAALTAAGIAW